MVASAAFGEFLREMLAPLGHVALRRMFGKAGVFCDGVMLAFWRAPERLFDDPDAPVVWGRLALAAARRVAAGR